MDSVVHVTDVALDNKTLSLVKGTTGKLTAAVEPANATNKKVTWSSSNADIADVTQDGTVTAKKAGQAKITVTTEDGNKKAECTVTVTDSFVHVTGVALDNKTLSLVKGTTGKLTAAVEPANAANKKVTWSSSNADIADTAQDGTVTAKKAGQAKITVTTEDGNKKAECTVTVTDSFVHVTGVALDKTAFTLIDGASRKLSVSVEPANATNKKVTWSSSNADIADVAQDGTVTAKKAGQAKITVTAEDGNKKAECTVTVEPVPVTGIKLDKTVLTLIEGASIKLIATVEPANAANKKVKWGSDNAEVADVDQDGTVTAKKIGQTKITVITENGNKKAECTVTVKPVSVTSVRLDKTTLTLVVGLTGKLAATVEPANAVNKKIKWSSDNAEVADVDQDGTVTAKKAGQAKITVTAEDGNKKAECSVTVNPRQAILTLSPDKMDIRIQAVTSNGDAITVDGCTETEFASGGSGTILHAKSGKIILKGDIIVLECSDNNLTAVDVQSLISLQRLQCSTNRLTTLDVHGLTSLRELTCHSNKLTDINLKGCTALLELVCNNNQLEEIAVQGLSSLKMLSCKANKLSTLDVHGLNALETLECNENKLTLLTVNALHYLQTLNCSKNKLTGLDINGCTSLRFLLCNENEIAALNVKETTFLESLDCSMNKLSALDVKGLRLLKGLLCTDNQLSALDIAGCESLEALFCNGNKLASINIDTLPSSLEIVRCYSNSFTKEFFVKLFNNLPMRLSGNSVCYLYTEKTGVTEHNYKDFKKEDLKPAEDKNWELYKMIQMEIIKNYKISTL